MLDHEKHGKLQVLDLLEYELDESQSLVVVEQELEFPLEDGCTFEEARDSTTLEPNHEECFAFLKEVHTPHVAPSKRTLSPILYQDECCKFQSVGCRRKNQLTQMIRKCKIFIM